MQLSFDFRPKPRANFRLPKGTRILHPVTGLYLAVGGRWARPVSFSIMGMIFSMHLDQKFQNGSYSGTMNTEFFFFAAVPA